uniref:Nuclear receptor interacting protein 2 n=1 Tax=Capra hircus TaxID=9925 RepID=A0A8C2QTT3_CAPHI
MTDRGRGTRDATLPPPGVWTEERKEVREGFLEEVNPAWMTVCSWNPRLKIKASVQRAVSEQQPHSVIQRRLAVEGSPGRPQGEPPRAQAPILGQESRTKTSKPERPALLVNCKCRDQELQVAVDTGTQYNQISAGCLSRLGLGKRVLKAPGGDLHPGPPALVEQLELQLGQETVECSAQVVDVESPELCLGLQTLLSLQCCIDLEHHVLRLKAPFSELPFLPLHQEPGQ